MSSLLLLKRRPAVVLAGLAALAVLAGAVAVVSNSRPGGTGGTIPSPEPPQSAPPMANAVEPAATAPGWEEEETSPTLSIFVNGSGRADIFPNWPLLVRVRLHHPRTLDKDAEPIVLAAKDGAWSNAVRIEVRSARGELQSWPLHLATAAPATLTLDRMHGGELVWWLSPQEVAELPKGDYTFAAKLDTTESSAANAWKGIAAGEQVNIRIGAEPVTWTTEQVSMKHQLLASYHLLRNAPREARAVLDELLRKQPDNISALGFQADVLAADGKSVEALKLYDRALEVFERKHPDIPEPPAALLKMRHALMDRLLREQPAMPARETEPRKRDEAELAEYSLWADTPAGKATKSPFPTSTKKLVFAWKSTMAAGEPVEVRWIAADTGRAAPPDYPIASSRSEPGKLMGEFTLTSPEAGWPAGTYRLELWRAGKLAHIEHFNME
jgi:hypothetical protein